MTAIVIRGGLVFHKGRFQKLEVRIDGQRISQVQPSVDTTGARVIDAAALHVFPGIVDVQVHFREPGSIHKEDLESGSRACARGGVTSFLEMPNTSPPATHQAAMDRKLDLAAAKSHVNYGFFVGATNDNISDLQTVKRVCGIKIFMGASTGDLLVDDPKSLERIFAETDKSRVIALHCEDEARINARTEQFKHRTDALVHTVVRDPEAAIIATRIAVGHARKYNHRTHILHVSTAAECELFIPRDTLVTAETSPHHLLLNVDDYPRLGTKVKMNPPVKYRDDNRGLWAALQDGRIGAIATDHAPHLLSEKRQDIWKAPAGIPAVENSLSLILDASSRGFCTLEQVANWMCVNPARTYRMKQRGEIEVGNFADFALVDTNLVHEVRDDEQVTKCGWSPWHGQKLKGRALTTICNGKVVYEDGQVQGGNDGMEIEYL
ncbi:MAG: dihydroorotase [Planctomycetes bacterium]|nr:dihydroorotase [Planctomycetota bacterium]